MGKITKNCVLDIQYTKPFATPRRDRIDGQDMGNYCFINESQKSSFPLNKSPFLQIPDRIWQVCFGTTMRAEGFVRWPLDLSIKI